MDLVALAPLTLETLVYETSDGVFRLVVIAKIGLQTCPFVLCPSVELVNFLVKPSALPSAYSYKDRCQSRARLFDDPGR